MKAQEEREQIHRERFKNPVLTKDQAIDVLRAMQGRNHARELGRQAPE